MRIFWVVFFGCLSLEIFAADADETQGAVDRLINTTELGQNLQTLNDYYNQVNKQLNKQVKNRQRDPFEKLVKAAPMTEQKAAKPRFIPRPKNGPAESKTLMSQLTSSRKSESELPLMQFRGFMKSDNEKAGLLEIEGQGTFVVHEGDKVGLRQVGGDMVIRVVEINALNLIVEFGSVGEKVVVQ